MLPRPPSAGRPLLKDQASVRGGTMESQRLTLDNPRPSARSQARTGSESEGAGGLGVCSGQKQKTLVCSPLTPWRGFWGRQAAEKLFSSCRCSVQSQGTSRDDGGAPWVHRLRPARSAGDSCASSSGAELGPGLLLLAPSPG